LGRRVDYLVVDVLQVGGVPERHRMELQDFTGRSTPLRYGAAVFSVAFALLVRIALHPQLGDQLPFVTFFAGIAAAAWFGGVGPSLLSAALGFALAELFFVHHAHRWWILTPLDLAIAASYFVVAATMVILTRAMHSASECAIARQIELEREIGKRIQAEAALSKAHDELEITDRKRAEEALRQSEERYRALAMATSQVVWTTDANGLVIDSPSWRAFTGQSPDQVKGWGWMDALHPDDRERVSARWSEAVRTQTIYETEYRIRRRDGEFLDVSTRGVPVLRADGSVREWIGICTDSTARKQAEEALIQRTRELERSNAELQQFAYVASHDLQEPLRVVANFTQLLAERYASQLDDDAREFIAFAVGGAVRMQQLIQDLLAYSRVGTQGRVLEPVDCNEALGRAVSNLRISVAENGALVSHDELPVIQADATQLVQLFQNLIGNGIKFRGANPPRVHISAVRKGDDWIFSVRDNGIGIEPQYAERIFALFQRLHRPEEFSGTGIGLTICKKIVERHGGKIRVESEPGHGSTFLFSIPAAGKKAGVVAEEAGVKQYG
jgi:PAS domain S-box-containing protein